MVIRVLKLISGEMIIAEVEDPTMNTWRINYPATLMPGEKGGIVFIKALPVSEQTGIELFSSSIAISSKPIEEMDKSYGKWVEQVKEQMSGIIRPGNSNIVTP